LHKRWQNTRSPQDKAALNKAVKELKQLLHEEKQQAIQTYVVSLSATEATDYSLWKTTKHLKQPQTTISPWGLAEVNGRKVTFKKPTY
jgi:starvation-inducible outer membrane lipoprotein